MTFANDLRDALLIAAAKGLLTGISDMKNNASNNRLRNVKKFTSIIVLAIAAFPYFFIYATGLERVGYWIYIWLGVFTWFVLSNCEIETKGLMLLVMSLFLAFAGEHLLVTGNADHDSTIHLISQLFVLLGGSLGGNYMSHGMLKREKT